MRKKCCKPLNPCQQKQLNGRFAHSWPDRIAGGIASSLELQYPHAGTGAWPIAGLGHWPRNASAGRYPCHVPERGRRAVHGIAGAGRKYPMSDAIPLGRIHKIPGHSVQQLSKWHKYPASAQRELRASGHLYPCFDRGATIRIFVIFASLRWNKAKVFSLSGLFLLK